MGYVTTFGEGTVQSANTSYSLIDITLADVILQWPQAFQDTANVVYDYMNITSGARAGGTITLPAANQASKGISFYFNNVGANAIQIRDNTGVNLNAPIANGGVVLYYLTDNTSQAGVWGTIILAAGGVAGVTSLTMVQPAAGLTINPNGAPQVGAVVETFALANALASIQALATTGYGVRSAADTWITRTIVGGNANIAIANGNGVAGNTSVTLNNALVGLTSINVGTMTLNANTITGTQLNQNLVITPNGTGEFQISSNENIQSGNQLKFFNAGNTFYTSILGGNAPANTSYTLPLAYPLTNGQVLASTTAGIMSWSNVVVSPGVTTTNAIAKYLNTTGQLANTAILIDNANNITGATSGVIGNIGLGLVAAVPASTANSISNVNGGAGITLLPNNGALTLSGSNLLYQPNVPGTPCKASFYDGANTNFVGLQSQAGAMVASVTYTLPNAGPTVANQFLTSTVPVANASTMSWISPGNIQVVSATSTASVSTNVQIPFDNTIPQIGEGVQLITVTITPRTAGTLVIEFYCPIFKINPTPSYGIFALFQDATANALAVTSVLQDAAQALGSEEAYLKFILTPAIPNVATTFRIRYGQDTNAVNTITLLDAGGGGAGPANFGGIPQLSLTVTELPP